jgi:hypothetical protein
MGIWCLEYFEPGHSTWYRRELFFSAQAKDAAVALYCRLGADDVLTVTSLFAPSRIRSLLRKKYSLRSPTLWMRRMSRLKLVKAVGL